MPKLHNKQRQREIALELALKRSMLELGFPHDKDANMDNRDWSYCARYIDSALDELKNSLWNGLNALKNKRAPLPSDVSTFCKCPGCGAVFPRFEIPKPNYCSNCGQAFSWGTDDGSEEKIDYLI